MLKESFEKALPITVFTRGSGISAGFFSGVGNAVSASFARGCLVFLAGQIRFREKVFAGFVEFGDYSKLRRLKL